jgi:divalent metal cation (Fe/Co/Zn/Cd) transporter
VRKIKDDYLFIMGITESLLEKILISILFWTGCYAYVRYDFSVDMKFRLLHPLFWVLITFSLIYELVKTCREVILEFLDEVLEDTVIWRYK